MFGIGFKEAFEGIWKAITTQKNFKVHLTLALIVILAAFYFKFTQTEWAVLVITITLVLAAETFNTAIEILVDHVSKKRNGAFKTIKDVSAGAVLLIAISSVIVGIILFYPKVLMLLR